MDSISHNFQYPSPDTIKPIRTIAATPLNKIEKGYTLKHFLVFYLADFIFIGLLIVISEFFF